MNYRLLIAISTSRYSRQLVDHALALAAGLRSAHEPVSTVTIDILYIIEAEELAEVVHRCGGEGFLGPSPQTLIRDALDAEHHHMATRRIARLRSAAAQQGYPTTVTEREGRFADTVIAHAEAHPCDVILITRADRPFISRLLFGSETARIARLARQEGLGEVLIHHT